MAIAWSQRPPAPRYIATFKLGKSALLLSGGIGALLLLLRKRWEVFSHFGMLKIVVMGINLLIVWYLVRGEKALRDSPWRAERPVFCAPSFEIAKSQMYPGNPGVGMLASE